MTATTPTATATPSPSAPRRSARWLTEGAARLMRAGVGATLRVTTEAGARDYYVTPRPGGYDLLRLGGAPATYTVDASLGGLHPDGLSCSCPAYRYRARRVGPCKHVLALAAALARLGARKEG